MNPFLIVAKEAFLARLLPVFHEVQLPAIHQFQPQHYPPQSLAAGMGAMAASVLLFSLGRWLRRWPERVSTEKQQARIETMRGAALHWLPWLLILSPTPFGGILIVAAGFFALPPGRVLGMILLAETLWRASPWM